MSHTEAVVGADVTEKLTEEVTNAPAEWGRGCETARGFNVLWHDFTESTSRTVETISQKRISTEPNIRTRDPRSSFCGTRRAGILVVVYIRVERNPLSLFYRYQGTQRIMSLGSCGALTVPTGKR